MKSSAMRPQRQASTEVLPEPIDVEVLAERNHIDVSEAVRLIRHAEFRGLAYSRISREDGRLLWYWRDDNN
jgi:hypothetical protein